MVVSLSANCLVDALLVAARSAMSWWSEVVAVARLAKASAVSLTNESIALLAL